MQHATDAASTDDESLLDAYDYAYPPTAVAHAPVEPRDASRCLFVPANGPPTDRVFRDIARLLRPGDLVVLNETRVLKARLSGTTSGGGTVELTLIGPAPEAPGAYRVLARPGKRLKAGTRIRIGGASVEALGPGLIAFAPGTDVAAFLERHGELPLPPYIHAPAALDRDRAYQTIFARVDGSVAAPTASLHFSEAIFSALAQARVATTKIVLDVGLGTFAPVRANALAEHTMHAERFTIPPEAAEAIAATRARGGRVVAVGTTVLRALESAADDAGGVRATTEETRLFVRPGFRFRVVDALVTNFHVPRSTLLVLVSAFAGRERILAAYRHAVEGGYRLFSFGDAMLLERYPGSQGVAQYGAR